MCALDCTVCDRCIDPVRPGVTVGKDTDGDVPGLADPVEHPAGGPGRLSLEMEEDRVVLLVKPVLNEPVIHTARLHGNNKFRIVVDEFDVFHVIGDRVPGFSYVVLAMNGFQPPPGRLPDPYRTIDACAIFLRPEMEPLAWNIGNNLKILDKEVAFVLCAKLCP